MIERVIIAGAGGQGIMLLGKVLACAALKKQKYVTWFPCYGAEVRGGTAYCMVVISDAEIGSPYIEQADTLIIMNQPSLEKFKQRLKNKGLLIVNSSLAKINPSNNTVIQRPFTDIAIKLGNIRVANMVALGCYLSKRKIIDIETVVEVIQEIAPKDKQELIGINKQALFKGAQL